MCLDLSSEYRMTPAHTSKDGILGVCAGVEMLRVLQEENIDHEYPVGVINWTK